MVRKRSSMAMESDTGKRKKSIISNRKKSINDSGTASSFIEEGLQPPPSTPVFVEEVIPPSFQPFADLEDIPKLDELPTFEMYSFLADHFKLENFETNLLSFWYLDVVSLAIIEGQNKLGLNQEEINAMLKWFGYILLLIKDNWSREWIFQKLERLFLNIPDYFLVNPTRIPSPHELEIIITRKGSTALSKPYPSVSFDQTDSYIIALPSRTEEPSPSLDSVKMEPSIPKSSFKASIVKIFAMNKELKPEDDHKLSSISEEVRFSESKLKVISKLKKKSETRFNSEWLESRLFSLRDLTTGDKMTRSEFCLKVLQPQIDKFFVMMEMVYRIFARPVAYQLLNQAFYGPLPAWEYADMDMPGKESEHEGSPLDLVQEADEYPQSLLRIVKESKTKTPSFKK